MGITELLIPHVGPFSATLARVAGLFIFAPIFGGRAIPPQIKALAILLISLSIYQGVVAPTTHALRLDLASIAPLMAAELLVGLSVGLIAAIPLMSVQTSGLIMSHKMGLRIADSFNPALGFQSDSLGQALFYMALVSFLAMGGAEALFISVAQSFERAPIGSVTAAMAPLDLVVSLVASGFELALRVSAPVLVVLFIETIAAGMIMKTVPQLNILSFGFAVKILVGLGALLGSLAAVQVATRNEISDAMDMMSAWVTGLG